MVLHLPQTLLTTGDASQLERLFGNLIDNAAKYAPAGGTITVRATLEPGPAPRITVSVHNTGSHIPAEALPHIFERFFRVDKSRAREVAGSGLGLAIAREVALRHGGSIQALSDPQTGTTFVVTLPLGTPVRSRRPGVQAPAGDRVGAPPRGGAFSRLTRR